MKADVKNETKVEVKTETHVDEKSKADAKSKTKEKVHSKNKNKNKSHHKHKQEKSKPSDKSNIETDKTLSERANDNTEDEDYHITGNILADAAKQLETSQDEDLEELGILDHDGFGEFEAAKNGGVEF